MSRNRNTLLRDISRLALRAGDLGEPYLEMALLSAVRLSQHTATVQGLLTSQQMMALLAVDEYRR